MHLRGSGSTGRGSGEQDLFQEGATATLTCEYSANPRAYNVTYMFNVSPLVILLLNIIT